MSEKQEHHPYKSLGQRLKGMREHSRESLAEVAGSVEIDMHVLHDIEQGSERPGEDILMLLISHFGVKEDEATSLWRLAGYDPKDITNQRTGVDSDDKNTVIVMPVDMRIAYTDMAHVVVNDHGVVMNFLQTAGPNNQPLVVSRLGMSREHAESIITLLQKTLHPPAKLPPKQLPAPSTVIDQDTAHDKPKKQK